MLVLIPQLSTHVLFPLFVQGQLNPSTVSSPLRALPRQQCPKHFLLSSTARAAAVGTTCTKLGVRGPRYRNCLFLVSHTTAFCVPHAAYSRVTLRFDRKFSRFRSVTELLLHRHWMPASSFSVMHMTGTVPAQVSHSASTGNSVIFCLGRV